MLISLEVEPRGSRNSLKLAWQAGVGRLGGGLPGALESCPPSAAQALYNQNKSPDPGRPDSRLAVTYPPRCRVWLCSSISRLGSLTTSLNYSISVNFIHSAWLSPQGRVTVNESFLTFSILLINHPTLELRLHLADGDEETKAQRG